MEVYFKEGQTVYSTQGKGVVVEINNDKVYSVAVEHEDGDIYHYTEKGFYQTHHSKPSLFQNPIIITPNIPLVTFKKGDLVLVSEDGVSWYITFFVEKVEQGFITTGQYQSTIIGIVPWKYCKKYPIQ